MENQRVRDFAVQNGLRAYRREDGEVVLRIGPRSRRLEREALGEPSAEAWYAAQGEWAVFVPTEKEGALKVRLLAAGAHRVRLMDGEIEARVEEGRLMDVLASSPLTRPRVRRVLSPERAAAGAARLAAYRERVRVVEVLS